MGEFMKHLFLVLGLLTKIASAESIVEAKLNHFNLDEEMKDIMGINEVVRGSVSVNKSQKTVTLTLFTRTQICPPGENCPLSALPPVEVTLPIRKVTIESCQIPHIYAVSDLRSVDGSRQEIVIVQNSKMKGCMPFRAPEPTEVKYTIDTVRGRHAEAYFDGDALKANF